MPRLIHDGYFIYIFCASQHLPVSGKGVVIMGGFGVQRPMELLCIATDQ